MALAASGLAAAALVPALVFACSVHFAIDSVTPSVGPAGTPVKLEGRGFEANSPISIRWAKPDGPLLGTTRGPLLHDVSVTIPSAPAGPYFIYAVGTDPQTGRQGSKAQVFEVTGDAGSSAASPPAVGDPSSSVQPAPPTRGTETGGGATVSRTATAGALSAGAAQSTGPSSGIHGTVGVSAPSRAGLSPGIQRNSAAGAAGPAGPQPVGSGSYAGDLWSGFGPSHFHTTIGLATRPGGATLARWELIAGVAVTLVALVIGGVAFTMALASRRRQSTGASRL